MNEKTIALVNNVAILVSNDVEKLVPIKPICDALGIDYSRQLQKLKEDDFLSSTMGLVPTVAADNKEREMVCLPLRYVFGWLFTINPKNVNPEAKEAVTRYRLECYDTLHNHFYGNLSKQIEANTREIELLEEINNYTEKKSLITSEIKERQSALAKIRAERLKNEPTLF
ncbi:MAG: phage antirepressor N-terminal domain-containing protein [Bacteroidales bacterium]